MPTTNVCICCHTSIQPGTTCPCWADAPGSGFVKVVPHSTRPAPDPVALSAYMADCAERNHRRPVEASPAQQQAEQILEAMPPAERAAVEAAAEHGAEE